MAILMETTTESRIRLSQSDNCDDRSCDECVSQFLGNTLWSYLHERKGTFHPDLIVSPENAKSRARELADQVKKDQKYTRDCLERYGDVVLSRWRKKSRQKKEALILDAQPNIYKYTGINQHVYFRCTQLQKSSTGFDSVAAYVSDAMSNPTTRNALLLPYLNLETLVSNPMRLLGLLHCRSAFSLDEWAPFDTSQMEFGFNSGMIAPRYNGNSVVLHGSRYGELVPYEPINAHYWTTVGFTRGVMVLEAQSVLYGFLRKCVDMLTADAPPNGNALWKSATKNGFSSLGETESWSPYINAPFSAPPIFNPAKFLRNTRAALAAAEDHIRYLQTDPAYFQDILHKQRHSEVLSQVTPERFWKFAQADAILRSTNHAYRLQNVVGELENTLKIYHSCRDQIHMEAPLPKKFDRAMGALELLCLNYYQSERMELKTVISDSPGFVKHFHISRMSSGKVALILKSKPGYSNTDEAYFKEDKLFWALHKLCESPEHVDVEDPAILLGLIDELLAKASDKERTRIHQRLYDHLSRMTCFYEMVSAVLLHRPCPRPFSQLNMTEEEKSRHVWRTCFKTPLEPTARETEDLSQLLQAFSNAQWPKGKHDQAWLEKATEARRSLATFWARAREIRRRCLSGIGWSNSDIEVEMALFSADQTEEYQNKIEAEKDEVARYIASEEAKKTKIQQQDTSPVQTLWGEDGLAREFNSKLTIPLRQPKPKSRPSEVTDAAPQEHQLPPTEQPELPSIPVNQESLRFFARMFPSSKTEVKGVVKWPQFVTAMADVGFSAVHCGGSAVHFGSDEGSIVFHKPHPTPNVDSVMLQHWGNRLRDRFNWSRERFVEREKKG